jgi:hypothetical protein
MLFLQEIPEKPTKLKKWTIFWGGHPKQKKRTPLANSQHQLARRHWFSGIPKPNTTVSVGSVLK